MPELRYENLESALAGQDIPESIRFQLLLIEVPYRSFSGTDERGQIVIHQELAAEVRYVFEQLHAHAFPIEKIIPIAAYGWDDDRSMEDNNTSAFNYRTIAGTDRLSNHALGRAIDINPRLNPSFLAQGTVLPKNGTYDPSGVGSINSESIVVSLFAKRGWRWLGDRGGTPDYQHFDKSA